MVVVVVEVVISEIVKAKWRGVEMTGVELVSELVGVHVGACQ